MFWTDSFWPYIGGIERFGMQLVEALAAMGHELMVVTSHGSLDLPDRDDYRGTPVHRFPFIRALTENDARTVLSTRAAVARLKREFRPQLVHANVQDPGIFFHLHTAAAWPAPTLVTIHGEFRDCGAGPETLLGRILRGADHVNTVSGALLDDLRSLVPEVRPRSSLVYNACPAPARPAAPARTDPARLLCFGRQVHDKGFDVALRAFARVVRQRPGARMTLASDGPDRPALEQLAASLGIAEFVEFPGWQTDARLDDLIAASTAVVVPSRWREGFGLVALEAALRARAVVATRVGGLAEVVEDGITGLLVDNGDCDALGDALCRLLAEPGLAARMGEAAHTRALARFDFQAHVRAYDALYRECGRRDEQGQSVRGGMQ